MKQNNIRTKLYISLPDSKGYEIYQPADGAKNTFTFAAFNGGRKLDLPMAETEDEAFYRKNSKGPVSGTFPGREDYEKLIRKTIGFIRDKDLGKIVISRARKFELHIDPVQTFRKLVKKYPSACVYLFTHPETGTWMGATPETLLKKQEQRVFTMSLAGTRKKGEEHTFTSKEEEEQRLVTEFITKLFRVEPELYHHRQGGPVLSEAGNLVHFKTEISATASLSFDESLLMEKLHPTPAVAGFPKKEALEFIRTCEGYDRAFYSGYFGLKNGSDFHYFVNLRCMQVFTDSVILYAGGGITGDSDPGAEWEETEAKMRTLRDVLEEGF